MACNNCSETSIQFECGDSPRLICVQLPTDPTPIPAWAVPVCVAGVVTTVTLYSNEAATDRLVGYTLADRVPCPTDMRGTSCEGSLKTDLCAATMIPLLDTIQSVGEEIETAIATQTSAIQSTIESVGEEIETAISEQTAALQTTMESVGEEIEAAIAEQTAILVNGPNYAYAYTYTANGDVETITRTTEVAGFPPCEVQTYSYNGSFQLTGISAWVPCP